VSRRSQTDSADPAEIRRRARRVLDRVGFGPAPGETDRVAAQGAVAWLGAELEREDPPLPALPDSHRDPAGLIERFRSMDERGERRRMSREFAVELAGQRVAAALAATAPLHERMVDFFANHFAVFVRKGIEPVLLPSWERDVLRRHALGRFEDLLLASARHPAMLFYLDNWRSVAETDARLPRARRQRRRKRPKGQNENYARELLELHTLGVDAGYTQRDVEEVARAFTGWTLDRPRGTPHMRFVPAWHDDGPKSILGTRLPAGGGERDGERVIALLARHPQTARHLAHKLAVRFVSDRPPAPLVERVAKRFLETDGDLRATLGSLLLEGAELFDAASVKVKTPFELVVSSLRAMGGHVRDPRPLVRTLHRLGHVPYGAPTPAGFPDVARDWIDPGSMLERTHFAFRVGASRVRGVDFVGIEPARPEDVLPPATSPTTHRALATPGLTSGERLAVALASPEFQLR
jgi:uncharacterized protein (DUF1800 family)